MKIRNVFYIGLLFLISTLGFAQGNFFLDSNGVTVKCTNCVAGDTGVVNGLTYTAHDVTSLYLKSKDDNDWDRVCTSLVSQTSYLFANFPDFNQDISSWDVSSVTNMSSTFHTANSFNQDLSSWNVDNVTIYCGGFCYGADSWTLPKPNFTNCSYDLGCN